MIEKVIKVIDSCITEQEFESAKVYTLLYKNPPLMERALIEFAILNKDNEIKKQKIFFAERYIVTKNNNILVENKGFYTKDGGYLRDLFPDEFGNASKSWGRKIYN